MDVMQIAGCEFDDLVSSSCGQKGNGPEVDG